jgi:hypothetical protein
MSEKIERTYWKQDHNGADIVLYDNDGNYLTSIDEEDVTPDLQDLMWRITNTLLTPTHDVKRDVLLNKD